MKQKSVAAASHKIQKSFYNPAEQKLVQLLAEPHRLTKNAFAKAEQAINGQFIVAKNPFHLKKSVKIDATAIRKACGR